MRELIHALHEYRSWVAGVALSPDEKKLASSGADGSITI